jgi:hypothetical protein
MVTNKILHPSETPDSHLPVLNSDDPPLFWKDILPN